MRGVRGLRFITALALVAALSSGCFGRKKAAAGGSTDFGDTVGVIGGSEIGVGELGMGDERMFGDEVRGQFTPVYFEYDSARVNESERGKAEAVASYLRGNPAVGVVVEGHTDERGSNEYNLGLGERRALAVRAYLIGLGIDASKVQTKSFGEESPAAMGHGEDSWRLNRRAEFTIIQ